MTDRRAARCRAVAVVTRADSLLMVRIESGSERYWTLPGGGVDDGETAAAAAVRELREETGLVGVVRAELLRADAPGPHTFFRVDVEAGAVAQVGYDPELPPLAQEITAVRWRRFDDLGEDPQVRLLTAALGPRWWDTPLDHVRRA